MRRGGNWDLKAETKPARAPIKQPVGFLPNRRASKSLPIGPETGCLLSAEFASCRTMTGQKTCRFCVQSQTVAIRESQDPTVNFGGLGLVRHQQQSRDAKFSGSGDTSNLDQKPKRVFSAEAGNPTTSWRKSQRLIRFFRPRFSSQQAQNTFARANTLEQHGVHGCRNWHVHAQFSS